MTGQIIIALSGRKGSGKNTIAQFIKQYWASKKNAGNPFTGQIIADGCFECSFADNLKQFCIETLGLEQCQCYGSDEEKETPTKYNWDDVPPHLRWKFGSRQMQSKEGQSQSFKDKTTVELAEAYYRSTGSCNEYYPFYPEGLKTGRMTGRDIMQIFGTELIRETFGNVWADATIRRIKRIGKPLSIITDNRFPNEIQSVLNDQNGFIIRLTRSPFGTKDLHPSEASLDDYDWNRERCFVLSNDRLDIEQQNQAVMPILDQIFAWRSI